MLAVAYDPDKLIFPSWASSKLDGIRTLCINGTAVSRNLKPIPNNYIRNLIEHHSDVLDGYDGELLLADTTAPFNDHIVQARGEVYTGWKLRELDKTKIDWHSFGHTHFILMVYLRRMKNELQSSLRRVVCT